MQEQRATNKSKGNSGGPNGLIRFFSALLAPLGFPWAIRVREEAERYKREAEERLAKEVREKGEQLADSAKPSTSTE